MKAFNITKDGIIEYYGNKAGFVREQTAAVDTMFKRKELEDYLHRDCGLDVIWKDGIYDSLASGKTENEDVVILKQCRIHQLKPETDVRIKFIGYEDLQKRGFGKPSLDNYRIVYDGDIGTNDLEEIYRKLNQPELPESYSGYSLSTSDIIELYDEESSELYYVDKQGFVKLEKDAPEITETESTEQETDDLKTESIEDFEKITKSDEFLEETFKFIM